MDILEQLERLLAATPEHQAIAPNLSRRQLVATITELRRLRAAVAAVEADAQARTGNNPNI